MLRLFKYKAHIHVPDSENQLDFEEKGLVQVDNPNLSDKDIIKEIIRLKYNNDKDVTVYKITQILIIK